MKKKPKTRWKWGLLTIVSLAAIIGGPFIINECYKSNTGYMTRWNAADVLAYYGTILAAAGAVGGVFLSLKYSHKQYREDKRRDVLPYFSVNILERNCILAGILMDKMSKDDVLRKSAQQDGEQIFTNSVFSKAYDKTAMDSYKESREVFGALFSDPKKYAALKNALAEIMYREFQK